MTDERVFDHRPDPELAAALRRGIVTAAAAAALAGFLVGRVLQAPEDPATLDAALTPVAFINATDPPDASVVFSSPAGPPAGCCARPPSTTAAAAAGDRTRWSRISPGS